MAKETSSDVQGKAEAVPELTDAQRAAISALSKDDRVIQAPVWLAKHANVPNDAIERNHAIQDPEGFWRDKAKHIEWTKPFEQVMRFEANGKHEWFTGGKLNATVTETGLGLGHRLGARSGGGGAVGTSMGTNARGYGS